jgi:hypothetical protein
VVFVNEKYFVIFDDLACKKPAKFSWLYHILPHDPIGFDEDNWTIDYKVGDVPVRIVHTAYKDNLDFIDMKGGDGFKNPLNEEDYTLDLARVDKREEEFVAGHNLYISNRIKRKDFHFLSVIAPVPPGEDFPEILHIDDWTVVVDGVTVGFNPAHNSNVDILIDVEAIRGPQPGVAGN